VSYFQSRGRAEREIEPDLRGWLRGFYSTLSADTMPPEGADRAFLVPPGGRMRDRFVTGALPRWLTERDLDVCVADFERAGFAGALNRYRNMDRDWADLAAYDGAAIHQASLFIGGSRDA
jgi:hypothetical protein